MNDFAAVVLPFEPKDSYVWLRIGRGRLACHGAPGLAAGQKLKVHVRPADVLLAAEPVSGISARNVFEAAVMAVRTVPEGVYVEVDAGYPLFALVTQRAAQELGVRKGRKLTVIIKATSVEIRVPVRAAVRVAAQGTNGVVDIKHVDLLRAIAEQGSLTVAAKTLGVTYRTAWLWAEAMNEAWGKPLLKTVHGGKGGGGAWVTPEGTALLEFVARVEASAGA